MTPVDEKLARILRFNMGIHPDHIRSDASLTKDYEFGSFEMNCFAYFIEIYFNINVKSEEVARLSTVTETLDFLQKRTS